MMIIENPFLKIIKESKEMEKTQYNLDKHKSQRIMKNLQRRECRKIKYIAKT